MNTLGEQQNTLNGNECEGKSDINDDESLQDITDADGTKPKDQESLHEKDSFKSRLQDNTRNHIYHKIVHDYRHGRSKVYGRTDDLVMVVDEDEQQIMWYGLHERSTNAEVDEICILLDSWPQADDERCTYGISCLTSMAKDVIKQEIDNL